LTPAAWRPGADESIDAGLGPAFDLEITMSIKDRNLATAMEDYLTVAGVMSLYQLQKLLKNWSESNIYTTLSAAQMDCFKAYWDDLGAWMKKNGGDIQKTSGASVPGRYPSVEPESAKLVALYDGAFASVNATIGTTDFQAVKAIYEQLNFAAALADPETPVMASSS